MAINIFNLTDSSIASSANINGAKVQTTDHLGGAASQHGTLAAATTYILGGSGVRSNGATILGFSVAVEESLATGDRSETVDLQKSTGGGAWASILSAPITLNSSSTLLAAATGTLTSSTLVAGDRLRVVVAIVTGTTGNHSQGLSVDCVLREQAA